MASKDKTQKRHALRRIAERFGVAAPRGEYERLLQDIRAGRAEFMEKQSKRVSVFRTDISGKPARVWYDKDRHTVVTVFPLEGAVPAEDFAALDAE